MNARTTPKGAPAAPIVLELSQSRQGLQAQGFAKIGDFKVRVTIYSDSYKFQSTAHVHVWSVASLSWNLVHAIPYAQMTTPEGLVYRPTKSAGDFGYDAIALLAKAREILL